LDAHILFSFSWVTGLLMLTSIAKYSTA